MSEDHGQIAKPAYFLADEFHQLLEDQLGEVDVALGAPTDPVYQQLFDEFCVETDLNPAQIAELRTYLKEHYGR